MKHLKHHTIKVPCPGFRESELTAIIGENLSYSEAVAVSIEYVALFTQYFNDITGLDISLSFEELDSPKYYDEDTDKVYCRISSSDLEALWAATDTAELNRTVKDALEYETGRIELHGNELSKGDWLKPVTEWDLLQLELLLLSILRQHDVEEIDYRAMLSGLKKPSRIKQDNRKATA